MVAALVTGVLVLSAVGGVLVRRAVIVRGVIVSARTRMSVVPMLTRRGAAVSGPRHARERVDRRGRSLQGKRHQQHQQ